MLRTIFGKALFERRWAILLWTVAIFAVVFGVCMIFPPIRDTMGSMIGQVPESMRGWFGTAGTWSTYLGYLGQEVFAQMSLYPAAMAIFFGLGLVAGEEAKRTLQTVLSRPVRRINYYLQQYLALVIVVVLPSFALWAAIVLAAIVLGEAIAWQAFAEATLMLTLHSLALGTLTFALGALTGRKSAGVIVGFYAFISYFIVSLKDSATAVEKLSQFALYNYLDGPAVLTDGIASKSVWILLLAIVASLLAAAPVFMRRDLKTR